jgi:UPF0755 protein
MKVSSSRKLYKRIVALSVDGQALIARMRRIHRLGLIIGLGALVVLLFLMSAPQAFPSKQVILIKEGMTLSDISAELKTESVIRSKALFEALAVLSSGEVNMKAGVYYFEEPVNAFSVARRVAMGQYGLSSVRVTIPEGSSTEDIAAILKSRLPSFDTDTFLAEASDMEGELFPDTYFFLPTVTPDLVISQMRDTFDKKTEAIESEIKDSGHSLHDLVTMASILEKEAYTLADKRMIAGILWKRIKEGMPLQVDATFLYINGKNTYQLTKDDLAMNSPYNTYRNKGLPPGPITNPGLDSILAAATPEDSPYFFYLSDKTGKLYFSENFDEHKTNKIEHLN